MNKNAQVDPWGVIMGIGGAFIGLLIVTKMTGVPLFWKILSVAGTGVVGYIIGYMGANK